MKNSNLPKASPLVRQLDGLPIQETPFTSQTQPVKPMLKNKKNLSKLFIILGVFLALLVGVGIFGLVAVYNPAKTLLASVRQMETIGTETLPFVKSQDLEGIKNQLVKVRTQTDVIEKNLKVFAWS